MTKVYAFEQFGGPDGQQFVDRPVPEPGPGELLIEVRAAGVNPADWKIRAGQLGTDRGLPSPLGLEVSGVVTAVGPDVEGFAVDDEVLGPVAAGYGGFAEYTIVRAGAAVNKPTTLSFTDAAALPVAGATAYDGVHQLDLQKGQSLLILGIGGGVGVTSAQIARVHGITVIGTGSESKRELVESLGATLVTYGTGVADRIRTAAPEGVDGILDLVGGSALREVADLVRDRSKILSAADPATAAELGGAAVTRDATKESLDNLVGVVEIGLVDPRVTALYPLERAGDALAAVESGHATGKVVIEVSRSQK